MFLSSFVIFASLGLSIGQETVGCYVPGMCTTGSITGVSVVSYVSECSDFCTEADSCQFFSYSPNDGTCVIYNDCPELSSESCADCVSSNANCPKTPCDMPGKNISKPFNLI